MESSSIGSFVPRWAAEPIKAQGYQLSDSAAERLAKAEQRAGGLPSPEFYQNLPDHTIGPVTYAEQLGKAARDAVNDQIAANNEAARQRVQAHHGQLRAIA